MFIRHSFSLCFVFLTTFLFAQPPVMDAADIRLALQQLTVAGSVMYIAAHPDDENQAVLAYMANERKVRAAYLSLTRGDGGQNLIGPEKGALLGIMRSEELLNARQIDGAQQFFSRAIDFGYSKSTQETLDFWDHQKILYDVVLAIRRFRPDVLITRFTPEVGGHGHHLASAVLAREAFDAAGDPQKFPEQLAEVQVWQPRRLFWNAWAPALEQMGLDPASLVSIDVGKYNALLGQTYTEIAALSRSQHRCQGFGASPYRGSKTEYFQQFAGETAKMDILEGIDLSLGRLEGSAEAAAIINNLESKFDPLAPEKLLPDLAAAWRAVQRLPDAHWRTVKSAEIRRLMLACAGLWLQVSANDFMVVPGATLQATTHLVLRNQADVKIKSIAPAFGEKLSPNAVLQVNEPLREELTLAVPDDAAISNPYWLKDKPDGNLFRVADKADIGRPKKPGPFVVDIAVEIAGIMIDLQVPVRYFWTDTQRGERWREIEVVPPVSVEMDEPLYIFADGKAQTTTVTVLTHHASAAGRISFPVGDGWRIEPAYVDFQAQQSGGELRFPLRIRPPHKAGRIEVKPQLSISDGAKKTAAHSLTRIDYDHIPISVFQPELEVALIKVDVQSPPRKIAYISGSGDDIPEALRRLGYQPDIVEIADVTPEKLKGYDVVISGIRAYNIHAEMAAKHPYLLKFVEQGGTLVVQYNTAHRLKVESIGPYPLKLSRERVTDEFAAVSMPLPDHPLLHYPNKISTTDFAGWVQERGLYFAGEWDDRYEAILSSHDFNEPPRNGGLLYAEYGDGVFIYSGYSWFRQLPAGVAGAYRIFGNLINARQGGGQ